MIYCRLCFMDHCYRWLVSPHLSFKHCTFANISCAGFFHSKKAVPFFHQPVKVYSCFFQWVIFIWTEQLSVNTTPDNILNTHVFMHVWGLWTVWFAWLINQTCCGGVNYSTLNGLVCRMRCIQYRLKKNQYRPQINGIIMSPAFHLCLFIYFIILKSS